jgi:hypothetical protein
MADALNLAGLFPFIEEYARDNKDNIFEDVYGYGPDDADAANGIQPMSAYCAEMDTPDEVIFTYITGNGALRPGGKLAGNTTVFAPKADVVNFKPRKGKVRHIAMDFEFTQEKFIKIYKSYMSAARGKHIKADELPLEMYIMKVILSEAREELRLAYWNGIYDVSAGHTSYLDVFDGFKKQILDAIGTDIPTGNVIDTAVITAANAVGEFDKIVDAIPTKYLSKLVCIVPRALKTAYERNYRSTYNSLPYNQELKKTVIEGTSIPFLVEPGLDGFTRPILTTRDNLTRLYDSASPMALGLQAEYSITERAIKMVFDGQAGCGFAVGNHIWTNDGV